MPADPFTLVVVAFITAGGLITVALINLYGVNLANKNALRAAAAAHQVEVKLAETSKQTDAQLKELKEQGDEIHNAVNGRLSVAQNTITWLEQQLYASRQQPAMTVEEATDLGKHDPRAEPKP
jgi:hypothetical protein